MGGQRVMMRVHRVLVCSLGGQCVTVAGCPVYKNKARFRIGTDGYAGALLVSAASTYCTTNGGLCGQAVVKNLRGFARFCGTAGLECKVCGQGFRLGTLHMRIAACGAQCVPVGIGPMGEYIAARCRCRHLATGTFQFNTSAAHASAL